MNYEVRISDDAKNGIEKLKKAGNIIALNKITSFLEELADHPRIGTGHPEQLKRFF